MLSKSTLIPGVRKHLANKLFWARRLPCTLLITGLTITLGALAQSNGPAARGGRSIDWTALDKRVEDLIQRNRIDEAVGILKRTIKAARERGETSSGLAGALNDLGAVYYNSGRFIEAEHAYKESLSQWERVPAPKPRMGIVLGNLAGLRFAQGKLSDAEKLYGEAKRLLSAGYGPESREVAYVLCGLADVYWETRRYDDARLAAESALSISEELEQGTQIGVALSRLAKVAWVQNREMDAERLLRRAIEVWRTSLGPLHPAVYASGLSFLATVLSKREPDEADRLFRDALAILEAQAGTDHLFTGHTLLLYAHHLKTWGRNKEASAIERRGRTIMDGHSRENLLNHTLDVKAFQK